MSNVKSKLREYMYEGVMMRYVALRLVYKLIITLKNQMLIIYT